MKISPSAVLILSAGMMLSSLAAGQTPSGPVFTITMEQKGSAEDKSFKKTVEAGYWPCAAWNSGYTGGVTYSEKSVMGAQMNASPEGLLAGRGSIAAMKPGETMIFYVRVKSGSGNDGVSSVTLSTVGDGVFSYTVVTENDTWTSSAGGPVTEPGRRAFGPAGNTEAVIKRTVDGAILTFSEPDLEGEGDCDFFSILSGDNEPEEMPEVLTFKLSNEDLKKWQALQKVNNSVLNGYVDGTLEIKATLRGGPISYVEAGVSLDGCSELGMEEQGEVIASGKPEGGKFRFWVEPGNLLTVESDGESSAIITGSTPGKGTLYVEYTSPEGKTNTASQPASCVKIDSYNGGEAIPQIALFDIDGKKLPGVLKIPVSAQPSNIEELVDFVPADKSVLAAVGLPGAVELTGSKEGKTSLEASTNCGNETGPTVEVEVVNCSDETKAKLAEEMRIAKEAQKQAYKEIANILGSEEFAKAADRIAESTGNLAIKMGGAIIGSLSGGKADAGVKTAAKIYGVGSNLYDFVNGLAAGENMATASNMAQMIVELGGTDNQQAVASAIETIQAAYEFGQDLGSLIATDRQLQEAVKWAEHWNKYIVDVVRRQKICRDSDAEPKGTEQPPKEPKAKEQPPKDPVPPKTDPEKPSPQPDKPKPKTEEPSGDEPPADEPGGDEPGDPENPPVPPKGEPKTIGLPFAPAEDCGCKSSKELTGNTTGLSALETGLTNLGKCVEDFSKGPLTGYVTTLNGWKEITSTLDAAIKAGPEELKKVAGEAAPRIKLLLGDTKSFDETGRLFYENFKSCPESTSSGLEIMKSALTVTVDSITTKY